MNDFLKKKLLWIISIFVILLAIWGLLKYDLQQKRTVDGIDLSHHNTVTDWDKVNVKFVYAKRLLRENLIRIVNSVPTGEMQRNAGYLLEHITSSQPMCLLRNSSRTLKT